MKKLILLVLVVSMAVGAFELLMKKEKPDSASPSPEIVQAQHKGSDSGTGKGQAENPASLTIHARSAVVLDRKTGDILYDKNPDQRMYPASTTKILTALLAVEYGDMSDTVVVGEEANLVGQDASKAGLVFGEKIKFPDLIRALLLPSGNDAAYVIAVYIARKVCKDPQMDVRDAVDYFCDMMNQRAKKAGAVHSSFMNPDGYHREDHYTTAKDLAFIAMEAMKNPFIRQVAALPSWGVKDGTAVVNGKKVQHYAHWWTNTNQLLDPGDKDYFQYADGMKTGHTQEAGYCLVSDASRNGRQVLAVMMKSTEQEQWADSKRLLEYGLENLGG